MLENEPDLPPDRIIVVDNHPTDETPRICRSFDGLDEARDKNYPLERVIAADRGDVANYRLRIAYLWDHHERVRTDGIWGHFTRPSLFRLRGQPLSALRFQSTLSDDVVALDVRLKHYGYLERQHRQAKYAWYNQRDPGIEREDCYRHLAEIPGARHAPGPPEFVPWTE